MCPEEMNDRPICPEDMSDTPKYFENIPDMPRCPEMMIDTPVSQGQNRRASFSWDIITIRCSEDMPRVS